MTLRLVWKSGIHRDTLSVVAAPESHLPVVEVRLVHASVLTQGVVARLAMCGFPFGSPPPPHFVAELLRKTGWEGRGITRLLTTLLGHPEALLNNGSNMNCTPNSLTAWGEHTHEIPNVNWVPPFCSELKMFPRGRLSVVLPFKVSGGSGFPALPSR